MLIVAVLLQPGKTDAGALFTSGVSSAALNPRGTQSVLSKLTIAAAATFMLSALLLSLPAIAGDRSVLSTEDPNEPAPANMNSNANAVANTNAAGNSNSEANANVESDKAASDKDEAAKEDEKPADAEAKKEDSKDGTDKSDAEPKKDEKE
jgi:protein translocase SecG subunit